MQKPEVPLLLLCGAPGAGKSSVAWEINWLLRRDGVPVAHVDLDAIGYGPSEHFGSFDMKFHSDRALASHRSDRSWNHRRRAEAA